MGGAPDIADTRIVRTPDQLRRLYESVGGGRELAERGVGETPSRVAWSNEGVREVARAPHHL